MIFFYIPRGIRTWLANRPAEKKIFEEWLVQKKKRYYVHYIALSSFGTKKYGQRTMHIKKRNTSFHADGNSDAAKIRRELKIGGGYAYVMIFDGGFKVGLTNDLKRRLNQLNSNNKRHYEIVWSSSFSTYEAAMWENLIQWQKSAKRVMPLEGAIPLFYLYD